MKGIVRFESALWLGVIVLGLYLLAGPLFMNVWAARYWREVPAWFANERFHFRIGDKKYLSGRESFWHVGYKTGVGTPATTDPEPNTTCWVNPNNPEKAVHYLRNAPTGAQLGGRIAAIAGAAFAAALVHWRLAADRRRKQSPKPASGGA